MKNFFSRFLPLILGSLVCTPLFADEVRIAVAANFTNASRVISLLFEKQTGHKVKVSYGSTGKLYAQIANGAPFDVYLSADTKRPIKAVEDGLAIADSLFVYAKGNLVLWSANPHAFENFTNGEDWFTNANFKRIAIGNPKTVPYGLAAQQVIKNLGRWKTVQRKLVRGASISQTFQFVATGNTDAGFVAWSQAKGWQDAKQITGSLWNVPADYYQAINQSAVLLNKGKKNPAALAFLAFLKSKNTQGLIKGFGYGITEEISQKKNIAGLDVNIGTGVD